MPDGDDGAGPGGSAGWERPVANLATRPHPGVRLCRVAAAVGQRSPELQARADLELGEDFAQVVLDGARADEQPGADLRVGQAVAGQAGDLGLLGGERVTRFNSALAGGLAGGGQLAAGPL